MSFALFLLPAGFCFCVRLIHSTVMVRIADLFHRQMHHNEGLSMEKMASDSNNYGSFTRDFVFKSF